MWSAHGGGQGSGPDGGKPASRYAVAGDTWREVENSMNEVARNARHTFRLRYSEAQHSHAPPSYHVVSTKHPAYMRTESLAESLVARRVRGHRVITVIVTVTIVLLTV